MMRSAFFLCSFSISFYSFSFRLSQWLIITSMISFVLLVYCLFICMIYIMRRWCLSQNLKGNHKRIEYKVFLLGYENLFLSNKLSQRERESVYFSLFYLLINLFLNNNKTKNLRKSKKYKTEQRKKQRICILMSTGRST